MELINIPIWWHFLYNETEFNSKELSEALQKEVSNEVWHNFVHRKYRRFDTEVKLTVDETRLVIRFRLSESGGNIESIVLYDKSEPEEEL